MRRYFLLLALTVLSASLQLSIVSAATQITGTITAKRGDTVKVEFQAHKTAGPKIGDGVRFSITLGGVDVYAGTGKITEIDGNTTWVKVTDSNPKLKMKAVIHATGLAEQEKIVQSNNPPTLHRCHELAGDPWDDQRVGPSIKFSSINADQAIAACEEAARRYPAVDRFSFQLARAYTAKGQYRNARFY